MKFNKNDFAYYLPTSNNTGIELLIIADFDVSRQKYKCYAVDIAPCDHAIYAIYYVRGNEIDFSEEDLKTQYSFLIPIINGNDFDESFYPVYDCEGMNFIQIRKAIRHFDMQSNISNKKKYRK